MDSAPPNHVRKGRYQEPEQLGAHICSATHRSLTMRDTFRSK